MHPVCVKVILPIIAHCYLGLKKKNSILKEGCPQTRVSLTEVWQKHGGSQGMAESPQRFPTSR